MKHKKVMALRLLVFALLFGGFAGCVSAAEKGVVIAMEHQKSMRSGRPWAVDRMLMWF